MPGPFIERLVPLLLLLAGAPGESEAQRWTIDTSAGQASYSVAPGADASRNGILGLRFSEDDRFFSISAAVPLSDAALAWGALALGDRLAFRRGGFEAGVDASFLAHGQRDTQVSGFGTGLMMEVLPVLSHNIGIAVMELSSGPRSYRARQGGVGWDRTFWTTELRAGVSPSSRFRFESSVRDDRGEDGERYLRGALSAAAMLGPVAAYGSLGSWIDGPEAAETEWGLSLSAPVFGSARAFMTARHESFDPHFLNPRRTSWGVGMSFQVGGSRSAAPASGAEVRGGDGGDGGDGGNGGGGSALVRVPLHDVGSQPWIAGDFSGWEPIPMYRHGHEWRFRIDLPPGAYRYALRDGDGNWFVPENMANRVDDGMGGWNAVLVVP